MSKAVSMGVVSLIVIALVLIVGFGVYLASALNTTLSGSTDDSTLTVHTLNTDNATLATSGRYLVTFEQIGACKPEFWGIPWSVTIGNTTEVEPPGTPLPLNNGGPLQGTFGESFSNITFSLADGTYSYIVSPSAGFFTPVSGNVTVAGSNVTVPIKYSGTSCTETLTTNGNSHSSSNQTPNTSTIAVVTSSTTSTVSTTCTITGQPAGIQVRILSDSNLSPVVCAKVYATNQPALCNNSPATPKGMITFTSTSTIWYSLPSENNVAYSFIVSYSDHNYTFSADLQPASMTCATHFITSGRTNVTITEFVSTC
ncbi:MAG: hypothetical protein JRN20_21470 [Nitrososphaerota archaeon]|nr:hypothetical protein [Nitrososphaerota archaeon]